MVWKELHTKDIIEFADTVKLYSIRVIDIQPFLLSYCIHGLSVEPPLKKGRNVFFSLYVQYFLFHLTFQNVGKLTLHHSQFPLRLSHTSAVWTASLYKQHGLSSQQAPGV